MSISTIEALAPNAKFHITTNLQVTNQSGFYCITNLDKTLVLKEIRNTEITDVYRTVEVNCRNLKPVEKYQVYLDVSADCDFENFELITGKFLKK